MASSTIIQQNAIPITAVEGANPAVGAEAIGTVIRLLLTDDNIANVVAAGMQRLVIERSIDGGLSFIEITEPSERPVLKADQPVMEVLLFPVGGGGMIAGKALYARAVRPSIRVVWV